MAKPRVYQDQNSSGIQEPFGPSEGVNPTTGTTEHPEYYNSGDLGDQLPAGFLDSLGASLGEAVAGAPVTHLYNYFKDRDEADRDEQRGAQMLSADDANKLYPEVARPFTAPVYADVAADIANRARANNLMARDIENGPQNFLAKVTRGTAAFGASLADPIGAAVGIATGGAVSALDAGFLGSASLFALGGAGISGVDAFTANEDQRDFSVKNALLGIIPMSVVAAGLHALLRAYGPDAARAIENAGVEQMAADKVTNTEPFTEARSSEVRPPPAPKDAESILTPSEWVQKLQAERPDLVPPPPDGVPLSAATPHPSGVGISSIPLFEGRPAGVSGSSPISHDFGEGIYLTDNLRTANGMAASRFAESPGRLSEVRLQSNDIKLLSLDRPLDAESAKALSPILSDLYGKDTGSIIDSSPARKVMEDIAQASRSGELPDDAQERANQALTDAGFSGFTYHENPGVQESERRIFLFDKDHTGDAGGQMKRVQQIMPDMSAVPPAFNRPLQEYAQSLKSIVTDRTYDPDAHADLERLLRHPHVAIPDVNESESLLNDAKDRLDQLKAQGAISEDAYKAVSEKLSGIDAETKDEEIGLKAAMACIGKGL